MHIRTYVHTDATSWQNAICPTAAFQRRGHKNDQSIRRLSGKIIHKSYQKYFKTHSCCSKKFNMKYMFVTKQEGQDGPVSLT